MLSLCVCILYVYNNICIYIVYSTRHVLTEGERERENSGV